MIPLNLSYSSLEELHACGRKYEMSKMYAGDGIEDRSIDLIAGSSFGAGMQHLLVTKDFTASVWEAYKAWVIPKRKGNETRNINEESKKKKFCFVVAHLEKLSYGLPDKLEGWEVWTLPSGRPAIEVGFKIAFPNGSFYRGFIDAILCKKNWTSGEMEYAALEIKTTGFEDVSPALYQNSFQGNSYAFITDYLTGRINPITFYYAAEFPKIGAACFDFYKSSLDKISWLPSLAQDFSMLEMYIDTKHFPMRGASCFNYYRPCKYLGICNLSRNGDYKPHEPEDDSLYDFNFTIQELLTARQQMYGA